MMYYWNGNWGVMLLMMLLNGVVWIALVGALIWAVSRFFPQRTPTTDQPQGGPTALEILCQRYARGEIDEATFTRMRQQLQSSADPDTLSLPPRR